MSAEQRGPALDRSVDEPTREFRPIATDDSNHGTHSPPRPPDGDSDRRSPPLSYRIERAQLRTRIAALERALETSEHRRQAIIDRYERLLAERADETESGVDSETTSRSLVARFIER